MGGWLLYIRYRSPVAPAVVAAPAQTLLSGQPYVVYHTGDNIEVTQYFAGGKNGFNEANAMDLLTKECGGAYRIVKRTNTEHGDKIR